MSKTSNNTDRRNRYIVVSIDEKNSIQDQKIDIVEEKTNDNNNTNNTDNTNSTNSTDSNKKKSCIEIFCNSCKSETKNNCRIAKDITKAILCCCGCCGCCEGDFSCIKSLLIPFAIIFHIVSLVIGGYSIVMTFSFFKFVELRIFYIIISITFVILVLILPLILKCIAQQLIIFWIILIHMISYILISIQYYTHYIAENNFTFSYIPMVIFSITFVLSIIFMIFYFISQ